MHLETIAAGDVVNLTHNGKIDVVVVAGAPSDPRCREFVNSVAGTRKNPPTILSVDLGDVDFVSPAATAETIGDNAFPKLGIPDDEVDTIGVATALVAEGGPTAPFRKRVYDNAIKELTRALIERHGELAGQVPVASLVSAPDKENETRFPIAAGTNNFLDDTDTSWATLFSDQIWNVVLVGGRRPPFSPPLAVF